MKNFLYLKEGKKMRLIDADELVKDLSFLYDDNGFVKNEESRKILTTICEQPTAYDIDKVVDELEKLGSKRTGILKFLINKAIEIVKNEH